MELTADRNGVGDYLFSTELEIIFWMHMLMTLHLLKDNLHMAFSFTLNYECRNIRVKNNNYNINLSHV